MILVKHNVEKTSFADVIFSAIWRRTDDGVCLFSIYSFLCKMKGIDYPWRQVASQGWLTHNIQYIPRNMHTVFALLCFVVVIHWLISPYPSGLLHWHCGNLTIAPVPAKQPWWIWINTSCEFIMNDCITITKQSTTKPCAYFLGYTVRSLFGGAFHSTRADYCRPTWRLSDSYIMSWLISPWDIWGPLQ